MPISLDLRTGGGGRVREDVSGDRSQNDEPRHTGRTIEPEEYVF